jgi:hypothetical protein
MKSFIATTIVAIAFAEEEAAAVEAAPARTYASAESLYSDATDNCDALVAEVIGAAPRRGTDSTEYDAAKVQEDGFCACYSTANAMEDEAAAAISTAACNCLADETSCAGAAAIATGAALFAIAALLQ